MTHWLLVRDAYDPSFFDADELAAAKAFRLPKRREEWLLSRFAAKRLALQLGVASDPREIRVERPVLFVRERPTSWFVSLSHSAPYAAAALAQSPVGIDIQAIRELSESAAHLFLSDEEAAAMRRCAIAHRVLHFWCAKEAAWKQRGGAVPTMKQVPLRLLEERLDGLRFDAVETSYAAPDLIFAITRSPPATRHSPLR